MKLFFHRPITSYAKVQALVGRIRRNRPMFLPRRIEGLGYLDLGCGPNMSRAFINLDYDWKPGVDVVWDITRGLPFRSGSLQGIFTEHCLEHLPFAATAGVLREARRILAPGGRIRIVVPDGEIYLGAYAAPTRAAMEAAMPYWESDRVGRWHTPMVSVNRIFRDHGHQFIYDFATLRHMLEDAGFSSIEKRRFREGGDDLRLRDTEHRQCESLYVEAVAPR